MQREPTGPVPVVNRFDNYMRNHQNLAASFQTLFHRHGAGGESVLAATAALVLKPVSTGAGPVGYWQSDAVQLVYRLTGCASRIFYWHKLQRT